MGMEEMRMLSCAVEEVVPAERKGYGGGNASSESIWELLGSASSFTGKPVSCCWRFLHGAAVTLLNNWGDYCPDRKSVV